MRIEKHGLASCKSIWASRKARDKNRTRRPAHTKISDMMAQALHLCLTGLLRQAEVSYRDVLTTQPANADALNNLGLIAVQTWRLEEARYHFQNATKVAPNQALFHLNLVAPQDLQRNDEVRRESMIARQSAGFFGGIANG